MRRLILFIFVIAWSSIAFSQQNVEFSKSNFKNDKSGLKEALLNIEDGDYYYSLSSSNADLSLKYYLKANKFNPNNALLNFKIGLCYLDANPASKALEYLNKAKAINKKVDPKLNYYIARALHLDLKFSKAIKLYELYKDQLSPREASLYLEDVSSKIAECKLGVEMLNSPKRIIIENLGFSINSEYPDYGAVVNIDESMMFYTARRPNTTGAKRSPSDEMYYEDAYWTISKDRKWLDAKNMGKPINTIYHDAVVGIAPDGNTLILYRDHNGGDLYWSKRKANTWSSPKAFSYPVNTEFQESSASFSSNGKRLFFVSNRDGGYGGMDIYYCDIDNNGKLGKAVNVGNTINTSKNEIGVFAHADGKTIYFSSTGHNGIGDYDVYKSVYENNKWSKAENLGYPINTPGPEVFFSIGASGRNAYYSSNRKGGFGGQDIYGITFLGPEKHPVYVTNEQYISVEEAISFNADIESKLQMQTSQLTLLKGIVVDEITQKPIEAVIELIDNEAGEVLARFNSNSVSGKYVISLPSGNNYGLAVYADDYLFYSDNFVIPKYENYRELIRNISLQRVEIGSGIALKNVFFDYKKTKINKESRVELNRLVKLMKKYDNIRIVVEGHTDNIGGEEYNLNLSQKRAESVTNYLVNNGVARDRITAKGYGYSVPISSNDTDEGRKMNRRSEIKIIGK